MMLFCAILMDVSSMMCCGILIYSRKQSLTHLPMLWISQRGYPNAAAVDAAPILSECDDMLTIGAVVSFSALLMSFLVRYLPLENVKNGPFFFGCIDVKYLSALIGHSMVLFLARRIVNP